MHGTNGGPKTAAGKLKCKMAPLIHGFYSKENTIFLNELKDFLIE